MPTPETYRALQVRENEDGSFSRPVETLKVTDLPAGDLLVRVHCSALNYKDALSATGNKGVTRKFPHTPGIDAAGVVEESASPDFKPGDEVIVTSYDLGMNTPGGFGEYVRVPAGWAVPKPEAFTFEEAMTLGTAGLTAGLALYKMERCGQTPAMGKVLVTGASGGVGSMAIAILAKAGYEPIAVTGSPEAHDFLKGLGATEIVERSELSEPSPKPIAKPRWAGVIDTVGGAILDNAVKACAYDGTVAVCGLVGSPKMGLTVFPFIIKSVNVLGVDSAEYPMEIRQKVWGKLADEWKVDRLDRFQTLATLDELNETYIPRILEGKTKGRVVVKMS